MTPSEEVRKLLDELGVEHDASEDDTTIFYDVDGNRYTYNVNPESGWAQLYGYNLTPAQAIAATVGKGKAKAHPWGYERDTGFFDETRCECGELNDISARYCNQCGREIQIDMSVIEYAEDWYTPQHVCKVNADGTLTSLRDGKTYVDAATVGRRDTMELWPEWEQVLFANVSDEVAQDNLNECVHELLDKAATVGRSCESCPEMDNPDSYIRHLQSALRWHDEHVPRPTNPCNTCVVLRGSKPPEEVLFVHDEGGVTHYLPDDAGTCTIVKTWTDSDYADHWRYSCSECGYQIEVGERDMATGNPISHANFCWNCGRKVIGIKGETE